MLVVTLGVFILWLGWFGFNGGSQLALGSALDAVAMSNVLVKHQPGGGGRRGGRPGRLASHHGGASTCFVGLNGGPLRGLVSITAGPTMTDHYWAIIIGAIGAILCTVAIKLFEKLKLDDVVGAVPAHLVAGIWGTLAASIVRRRQLRRPRSLACWRSARSCSWVSWLLWRVLDLTLKVRVSQQVEELGQGRRRVGGSKAYPEFVLMPEEFHDED